MLKKIIIEWCTGFNGVSVSLADETLETPQYVQLCESVNDYDKDDESLPTFTYNIVGDELMKAVCEGDKDGEFADPECIEDAVSEADIKRICDHTAYLFSKFTDEQFEFKLRFNHIDS